MLVPSSLHCSLTQLTVSSTSARFAASDVSTHLSSVSSHAATDATLLAAAQASDKLAAFITYVATTLANDRRMKSADKERVTAAIKETQIWLDKVNRGTRPALSEYETHFTRLHALVTGIVSAGSVTTSPIATSSSPPTNGIHYGDPDDLPIEALEMEEGGGNVEIADLD